MVIELRNINFLGAFAHLIDNASAPQVGATKIEIDYKFYKSSQNKSKELQFEALNMNVNSHIQAKGKPQKLFPSKKEENENVSTFKELENFR